MGRIIIKNATVLTLDSQDSFLYPGFVEIRDDRIWKLGQWSDDTDLDEGDGEALIIDGRDKLIMPGMVDLHFHTSIAKVRHFLITTEQPLTFTRVSTMICPSGSTWTRCGIPPCAR